MERSSAVAGLERLADAFATLVTGAPDLMVDRQTHAPPDAVGWPAGRNFRVRLRQDPAAGQASAYYRVEGGDLELMVASSVQAAVDAQAQPLAWDDVPERAWRRVGVLPGDEATTAQLMLHWLRRRLRA